MWDVASILVTALVPAILFGIAAGITVALEVHEHRLRRGTRAAPRRLMPPGATG